jgi:hypothetical protein
MLEITELSVLLRAGAELPSGIITKRGEFIDGWNIVRTEGARLLEKRIRRRGWHFIRIADESRRSGVGESSQQAITCALKLAVRGISEYFNAVEVRHVHLTKYPWFVIARLGVCPYRIQQSPVQFAPDDALPLPPPTRRRHLPANGSWLYPRVGPEMLVLKEMLAQPRSKYGRAQ